MGYRKKIASKIIEKEVNYLNAPCHLVKNALRKMRPKHSENNLDMVYPTRFNLSP